MENRNRATSNLVDSFSKRARDLLDRDSATSNLLSHFSLAWITLIFPALLVVLPQALSSVEGWSVVFVWIVMVAIHLLSIVIDRRGKTPDAPQLAADIASFKDSYHVQLSELRSELAEEIRRGRKVSILWSTQKVALHLLSRHTFTSVDALEKCQTKQDVSNVLKAKLDMFVTVLGEQRERLFGYKSASKYNIVIYLYSTKKKKLKIWSRNCDNRLGKSSREWEPGKGHVGLTFLHNTEKLSSDISRTPEFFDGDERASDIENYRSFFSLPIPSTRCSGQPSGVFVVTSAHPSQFRKERDGDFLITCSHLLAIMIDKAIHKSSVLPS